MSLEHDRGSLAASATNVGEVWSKAVQRYESLTNTRLDYSRSVKSIESIASEVKEHKSHFDLRRHDGSKSDKLRGLVKRILTPIQSLNGMMNQTTRMIHPPGETIFAAFQFLISVSNSVTDRYDLIASIFEEVFDYLQRLRILERSIPISPEISDLLIEIFASILVLCAICVKDIRKSRIKIAMNSFMGLDNELAVELETFRRLVRQEEGMFRNINLVTTTQLASQNSTVCLDLQRGLQESGQILKTTDGLAQKQALLENKEQMQRMLEWFSDLDFQHRHDAIIGSRLSGTGQWLMQNEGFKSWISNESCQTIWCSGSPGSGKTVLLSQAIEHVNAHVIGPEPSIVVTLFCDFGDVRTHSEGKLLSNVVRQLAEGNASVLEYVKDFWEEHVQQKKRPTSDRLLALIIQVSSFFKRVFLFVDALDECSEMGRYQLLECLRKLRSTVHLMLTSRPHIQLDKLLHKDLIKIDVAAQESDLRLYVEDRLNSDLGMSELIETEPRLKKQIIDDLVYKANGIFLICHLRWLHIRKQRTTNEVRQALSALPHSIYDHYDQAFARIRNEAEQDEYLAKRAMSFIISAKRPLSLEELCHALSVCADSEDFDPGNMPPPGIFIKICQGLICVDEATRMTSLVHSTLLDYLNTEPIRADIKKTSCLGTVTLKYLSFSPFGSGPCEDEQAMIFRLQKYCLLEYSVQFCGIHLAETEHDMHLRNGGAFLKDPNKIIAFAQVQHFPKVRRSGWHDCYPKAVRAIHILAQWGLVKEIKFLIDQTQEHINLQDSHGMSPLAYAAKHGHVEALKCLIDYGASVQLKDRGGRTALHWAAMNGHESAARQLIETGEISMDLDIEGYSPLDWAIVRAHPQLVSQVLDIYSNEQEDLSAKNRALALAAEAGDALILQIFLDRQANPNWKDGSCSTALDWAVSYGHEESVRLLLQHGADVHTRDIYRNTPLHWAVPFPQIADLLIRHGAEINAVNSDGQSPLHWSTQDQQESFTRLLLAHEPDIDAKDKLGFTALHAAALKGNNSLVKLLLDHKANPNIRDNAGWTPLHAAAIRQHKKICEALLGCTLSGTSILATVTSLLKDSSNQDYLEHLAAQKSEGSSVVTGLRWAVSYGRAQRVQKMLDAGLSINAQDIGGWTALTIGAWLGETAIVKLLLQNNAGIEICERGGRSPLQLAAERGHLEILQLLVESGANIDKPIRSFTPILLSAKNNHAEISIYLLAKGADMNHVDCQGLGVLHWSIMHGSTKLLKKLLSKKGIKINALDCWGRTPLMIAVIKRDATAVSLLLKEGASIRTQTSDASNLLHWAAWTGDLIIARQLLASGADVQDMNNEGFAPIHIATFMKFTKMEELLVEHGANASAEKSWHSLASSRIPTNPASANDVSNYAHIYDRTEGDENVVLCRMLRKAFLEEADVTSGSAA